MVMIKRRDTCEQCAAKIVFLWIKSLTSELLERQEKSTWTCVATSQDNSTLV